MGANLCKNEKELSEKQQPASKEQSTVAKKERMKFQYPSVVSPPPVLLPPSKCLVKQCKENHAKHYCRVCNNSNSSHFSRQCPTTIVAASQQNVENDAEKIKKQDQKIHNDEKLVSVFKCKVVQCKQNHLQHQCRVCVSFDSDHFASQCPHGFRAFHGTSEHAYDQIVKSEFKISLSGTKGPGVYFCEYEADAKQIARYRAKITNQKPIVVQCMIPSNPNDVVSGPHPQWNSRRTGEVVTQKQFKEYCVKDPKRIRIIKKLDI